MKKVQAAVVAWVAAVSFTACGGEAEGQQGTTEGFDQDAWLSALAEAGVARPQDPDRLEKQVRRSCRSSVLGWSKRLAKADARGEAAGALTPAQERISVTFLCNARQVARFDKGRQEFESTVGYDSRLCAQDPNSLSPEKFQKYDAICG